MVMDKDVRRVPLDFDAPLNVRWVGGPNPLEAFKVCCPGCQGDGLSDFAKDFQAGWFGMEPIDPKAVGSAPFTSDNPVIIKKAKDLVDSFFGREPLELRFRPDSEEYINLVRNKTQELVEYFNGRKENHLNQGEIDYLWSQGALEYFEEKPTPAQYNLRSIEEYIGDAQLMHLIQYHAKFQGAATKCETCGGLGHVFDTEKHREQYREFELHNVPKGAGWQMWHRDSEAGMAPFTPVFASATELAQYCQDRYCGLLPEGQASLEDWLRFIEQRVLHENSIRPGL